MGFHTRRRGFLRYWACQECDAEGPSVLSHRKAVEGGIAHVWSHAEGWTGIGDMYGSAVIDLRDNPPG